MTSSAQPQIDGNTNKTEIDEIVLLPLRWTLEMTIIAIPAGSDSMAQIRIISKFSVLALSAHATAAAEREPARIPTPDSIDRIPVGIFRFTG